MRNITNIFLIGPMGAGKTSIGQQLARQLQRDFYDSDSEIETAAGTDIAWIFDIEGEDGMRKREVTAIDKLTQYKNIVLATGGGSILKEENRHRLASRGTVVYLKVSIEQQLKRTARNLDKRPLLKADNLEKRVLELAAQREPLYEEIADIAFETDHYSVTSIATKIIQSLRQYP